MNERIAAASSIVAVPIAVVAAPAAATGAMVYPTRTSRERGDASAQPMQGNWRYPKGNLRVLNTPGWTPANDVAAGSNR
jgi:hypothetical protein